MTDEVNDSVNVNEISRLRASVATQERAVATLESEIAELEREIDDFRTRYQKTVGFSEARLQGAKEALSQLERERAQAYNPVSTGLPPNFIPVEEQFRQRWARNGSDDDPILSFSDSQAETETLSPADLKAIYRKLARLYHPDFGMDEADRERRTRLMALINEAYAAGDVAALRVLQNGVPEDRLNEATASDFRTGQTLAKLELHQLRQTEMSLSVELELLKARQSELLNSEWMSLKVEEKLLKLRGRDMFKEMIAGFDREFDEVRARIDRLKS